MSTKEKELFAKERLPARNIRLVHRLPNFEGKLDFLKLALRYLILGSFWVWINVNMEYIIVIFSMLIGLLAFFK